MHQQPKKEIVVAVGVQLFSLPPSAAEGANTKVAVVEKKKHENLEPNVPQLARNLAIAASKEDNDVANHRHRESFWLSEERSRAANARGYAYEGKR